MFTGIIEELGTLEAFDSQPTGARLHLAEIKGPVMDQLGRTDLLARLGPARIHLSAHDAVLAVARHHPVSSLPALEPVS